uniref:Integrase core domain containing protein n=1 Tax=Solanum tuberosum TaxID=4113 RepID=M1DSW9_SOLTU
MVAQEALLSMDEIMGSYSCIAQVMADTRVNASRNEEDNVEQEVPLQAPPYAPIDPIGENVTNTEIRSQPYHSSGPSGSSASAPKQARSYAFQARGEQECPPNVSPGEGAAWEAEGQ